MRSKFLIAVTGLSCFCAQVVTAQTDGPVVEPTSIDHPSAESCVSFMLGRWVAKLPDKTIIEQWSSVEKEQFQGKRDVMKIGKSKEELLVTVRGTRFAPIAELSPSSQTDKNATAVGSVDTTKTPMLHQTTFNFQSTKTKRLTYTQTTPNELSLEIEQVEDGCSSTERIDFVRDTAAQK